MTYYLLVPVKGMAGFKSGMATDKIRVQAGRKGSEEAREKFERELNGGKTWKEWLEGCNSAAEFDAHKSEAWQVHSDTERSWRDYVGSKSWPAMRQVDEMINNQP